MGIKGAAPEIDWPGMQAYKQSTVDGNTKGIEFLFKKNKVDWLKGWGSITAPGEVKVGEDTHKARSIVIATGSEPSPLTAGPHDQTNGETHG
jgi:dihydrolipoamide dehydrogenase